MRPSFCALLIVPAIAASLGFAPLQAQAPKRTSPQAASTVTAKLEPYGIQNAPFARYDVIARGAGGALVATFVGGKGVVDHGIGEVTSGQPFGTGTLSQNTEFTLTVTDPVTGQATTSKTTIQVTDGPVLRWFRVVEGASDPLVRGLAASPGLVRTESGSFYRPDAGSPTPLVASYVDFEGQFDTATLSSPDGSVGLYGHGGANRGFYGGLDWAQANAGLFFSSPSAAPTKAPFDRRGTWTLTLVRNGITTTQTVAR